MCIERQKVDDFYSGVANDEIVPIFNNVEYVTLTSFKHLDANVYCVVFTVAITETCGVEEGTQERRGIGQDPGNPA